MFSLRPFDPARDALAEARLQAALETAEGGKAPLAEQALRAQLRWLPQGPPAGRWAAEHPAHPGELAGVAWAFQQTAERCLLSVCVHPAWRQKGLGSALLNRALDQARAWECRYALAYPHENSEESRQLLEKHGFARAGSAWRLHAPAGVRVAAPTFPPGYYLLTYARYNHLPTLAALLHRCYHDKFGHAENFTGAIKAEMLGELMARFPEHYPPQAMFLVFNAFGKAVGFGRARQGNILDAPGVVPEDRKHGLSRALAQHGMKHLQAQGAGEIEMLSIGDDEATCKDYFALEFELAAQYAAYQKEL